MAGKLRRDDLVYPELSYQIIGCAYEVFNELGFGHAEKIYQKAMSLALKNASLNYNEQLYTPLKFKAAVVGKKFFDFLVEDKIIVELKKNHFFSKANIDQVNEYLKSRDLKLALLINFTSKGVVYKRLVNIIDQP
jgi:GxxExxY protein